MRCLILAVAFGGLGCPDFPAEYCTVIETVGPCVEGGLLTHPHCRVILKDGKRIMAIAPCLVGDKVCRRGQGEWYYAR